MTHGWRTVWVEVDNDVKVPGRSYVARFKGELDCGYQPYLQFYYCVQHLIIAFKNDSARMETSSGF